MTLPFHIVALSGDAVFGLVAVVVWIWVSVMSNRKKANPQTPPPTAAGGPAEPRDPQSELRKFFEALEKGITPPGEEPEPAATPPPVPRQQMRRPAPVHRPAPARPVVREAAPAPVVAIAPEPAMPAPQNTVPDHLPVPAAGFSAFPVMASHRMGVLRSREGLRYAIIAAEILGPPVSVRQQSINVAALNTRP